VLALAILFVLVTAEGLGAALTLHFISALLCGVALICLGVVVRWL
jgi:hypothetical protein